MEPKLLSQELLNSENNDILSKFNSIPRYSRDLTTTPNRIAHIGVGGFHRSHMALYLHEFLNRESQAHPSKIPLWCIVGVGITPNDHTMQNALMSQNYLYTLIERVGRRESFHVVGSIFDMVTNESGSTAPCVNVLAEKTTKIISLTITPSGYSLNAAMTLNVEDPLVKSDVQLVASNRGSTTPSSPRTAVGVILESLRLRRVHGVGGVTVLSCDNIQHNGRVIEAAILAFSRAQEEAGGEKGMHSWIQQSCTFPNTMVDRITPATQDRDRQHIKSVYGIQDKCPVVSEGFRQWVIEDRFVGGCRPGWDGLEGVKFTPNVAPYEKMKLRLLNGSHLAVACLGDLKGISSIDEALRWPLLQAFMRALMADEVTPTIPPVEGINLNAYRETLVERFANDAIKDQVLRVATDAPVAVILDSLRDRRVQSNRTPLLALVIASWLRRQRGGLNESGQEIKVIHPFADRLKELGNLNPVDPRPQLGIREIFGNIVEDEEVVQQVAFYLGLLHSRGVASAIEHALSVSKNSRKAAL
jgi:mannitol-1-phosphate/altronate dehydrogenase